MADSARQLVGTLERLCSSGRPCTNTAGIGCCISHAEAQSRSLVDSAPDKKDPAIVSLTRHYACPRKFNVAYAIVLVLADSVQYSSRIELGEP